MKKFPFESRATPTTSPSVPTSCGSFRMSAFALYGISTAPGGGVHAACAEADPAACPRALPLWATGLPALRKNAIVAVAINVRIIEMPEMAEMARM